MTLLFEKDEISRDAFSGFLQSARETGTLIQKHLERTASLVQSFKQVSADQASEQQRKFNFRDYIYDILSSLKPEFKGKDIRFNIECSDKHQLNAFPAC